MYSECYANNCIATRVIESLSSLLDNHGIGLKPFDKKRWHKPKGYSRDEIIKRLRRECKLSDNDIVYLAFIDLETGAMSNIVYQQFRKDERFTIKGGSGRVFIGYLDGGSRCIGIVFEKHVEDVLDVNDPRDAKLIKRERSSCSKVSSMLTCLATKSNIDLVYSISSSIFRVLLDAVV